MAKLTSAASSLSDASITSASRSDAIASRYWHARSRRFNSSPVSLCLRVWIIEKVFLIQVLFSFKWNFWTRKWFGNYSKLQFVGSCEGTNVGVSVGSSNWNVEEFAREDVTCSIESTWKSLLEFKMILLQGIRSFFCNCDCRWHHVFSIISMMYQ